MSQSNNFPFLISIDWLQVFGHCVMSDDKIASCDFGKYTVKRNDLITPLWLESYDINVEKLNYATLYTTPRSSAIDSLSATLKLNNRVLYAGSCVRILQEIMSVVGFEYKGITRIDLCCDVNTLYDKRDVSSFLLDYVAHQPYCSGHVIRSGSRKFQLVGTRAMTGATEITGLRWGSPSSDVCAYCYDKTLELIEVKDKPWIRAAWEQVGLQYAYNVEEWDKLTDREKDSVKRIGTTGRYVKNRVWRFEISIKAEGRDLLNLATGEIFKLDLGSISVQNKVQQLFKYYAQKYLDFRVSTGQSQIKNYPHYDLLGMNSLVDTTENLRPVHVSAFADTGRTEKICANKLRKLLEMYSDLTSENKKAIDSAAKFLFQISGEKDFRIKHLREERYLQHLVANKFREEEIKLNWTDYFAFCDRMRDYRNTLSVDTIKSFWELIEDGVNYEIQRSKVDDDISTQTEYPQHIWGTSNELSHVITPKE